MKPRTPWVLAVILAAGVWSGPPIQAAMSGILEDFGGSFFNPSSPQRMKRFPTLETVERISRDLDLTGRSSLTASCLLQVARGDNGVKKARGELAVEVVVLDHAAGTFARTSVTSVGLKTGADGLAGASFQVPTQIFTDGFESGDVSAWIVGAFRGRGPKKASEAGLQCSIAGATR